MRYADELASQCISALSDISEGDRDRLADAILGAETVFVFGVGRSGLVAQMFSVRLVQLGLKVYFIGDMTTPIIGPRDAVILVSNSGDTMSVVRTAEIAKRIGTVTVGVTGSKDTDLAHLSDIVIPVCNPDADGGIAPLGTAFEDAVLLFFDSMVPQLMRRLGTTEEEMRRRHAIWV